MSRRTDDSLQLGGFTVSGLDLVRTVGHELKLPLMQIANAASLLEDGEFSDQEKSYQYQQLELSARRMLQIVDSVLYAGQVDTHQLTLKLEPTNVASVVHDVLVDMRAMAKRYNKQLNLQITQELSPAAVDPTALHHSLYGLVDMMIRSSQSSEIDILIHHQENSVMVTIRDQGPAFSMKQIRNAFNRLGRAAQPMKQIPSTTGMAFFVAYSLTKAMQGDLYIKHVDDRRILSLKVPLSQQMELV